MNAVEKKLLFIVNPRAGKTKSRAPLFDAVSIFSKAGYLVRVAETRRHGDATELAERFGGDFDLVVCHGLFGAAALLMVAGLQHTRAQYVYGSTRRSTASCACRGRSVRR